MIDENSASMGPNLTTSGERCFSFQAEPTHYEVTCSYLRSWSTSASAISACSTP